MTSSIIFGVDRLKNEADLQKSIKGNIGYLTHSCAVTKDLELGLAMAKRVFGKRLIKAFGPQHGFVTDVQDNMIETTDFFHPYFGIPIYSLYGETRIPTDEMLDGLDSLIVDLQDVGTRVYTYITTLSLTMEACTKKGITVVVLDRPNPVGGKMIEGPVLENEYHSFVGHHPIPQRHGLTMGEIAKLQKKLNCPNCDLKIITMENWHRHHFWEDTERPWINPSPNLSTADSTFVFCGSVLFEGTNVSEGRGTTRALEVVGAPYIEPFSMTEKWLQFIAPLELKGAHFKAVTFHPMFQKYAGTTCGGIHFIPINKEEFEGWKIGALFLGFLKRTYPDQFEWNSKPYEYQTNDLAINFINGSKNLKDWCDKEGSLDELLEISVLGHEAFLDLREDCLIYS